MTDSLVFEDPAGVEIDLTDHVDFYVLWGVLGRGMPKFDFVEVELPGRDGADLREVTVHPREVTVPLYVEGDDGPDLVDLLRLLARRLNPLRGDGILRTTRADGSTRELVCRYAGGLELSENSGESGTRWQRAVVLFRASSDPMWRAEEDVVVPVPSGSSAGGSFFPIPPIVLTSSSVFSEIVVDNEGDAAAWPVWTIVGPAVGITLENATTGQVFESSIELAADEYVVVDTRPGRKGITDHDGANRYDTVTGHDLWPLEPGEQTILVQIGDTTVESTVSVTYRPRFLTA